MLIIRATIRGNTVPTHCFTDTFLLLLLRDLHSFTAPWEILFGENIAENNWLFRYVISARMHADFRMTPYESALHSRDYEHTASIVREAGCVQGVALRQRLQQRLGFLEVSGVKPFGEPTVNIPKYLTRFFSLPLTLPESSKTGGNS
jgi:hypothetical protein